MEARRSDANPGFTSKHEVWRVEELEPRPSVGACQGWLWREARALLDVLVLSIG